MQAIALLDTLDKDVNTFVMRVREWYSWHFPELVRIVSDNYQYARLALAIQEKSELTEDRKQELTDITGAPRSILALSNQTCGALMAKH